jgi:hypothetical protein
MKDKPFYKIRLAPLEMTITSYRLTKEKSCTDTNANIVKAL